MKVIVYVEGKSDRLGMETLLRPLVEEKRQQGVDIQFYETPNGDRKTAVLRKVPKKAVNTLRNLPHSVVVALPDLYPRNKGFPHETVDELVEGVTARPAAKALNIRRGAGFQPAMAAFVPPSGSTPA